MSNLVRFLQFYYSTLVREDLSKVGYASIEIKECKLSLLQQLTTALTTSGIFTYGMQGFLDMSADSPIDEMIYRDYPLRDCSIQQLRLDQMDSGSLSQTQVFSIIE